MNFFKKLWENAAVKSAAFTLIKSVITAALATLGVASLTGCSSLTPTSKSQSMSVIGIGLPAIAVVTSSTQAADASGADLNAPTQTNPVTVQK